MANETDKLVDELGRLVIAAFIDFFNNRAAFVVKSVDWQWEIRFVRDSTEAPIAKRP